MENLEAFKKQLESVRPEAWEKIPDLELYMDQVISYMERQHIGLGPDGDETLTAAMVNNYIKNGLLPRARGKKYNREHMGYLTAICLLKQVLSVGETGLLLEKEMKYSTIEEFYGKYTAILDRVSSETAAAVPESADEAELLSAALVMAVESYMKMLTCRQILKAVARDDR